VDAFFERLRQRKIVQWALAYLAGAFALIQGVDIIAQQFGWPGELRRGVTIVLAIGFFVTIVLAWYHGERGTQRVSGTELLILALLMSIGGGLLWRLAGTSHESASTTALSPDAPAVADSNRVPLPTMRDKSIAILPFENLSEEKSNAYFASGMRDEILTRLAGIRDLKVTSRTSTEQYGSHPSDLRTIAAQLGVVAVLEGSVQRVGNAVHINVQLIDARNDAHLWAESYDRELKDIFGVERDVAEKVAEALKAKLMPEDVARVARVPTHDSEAYDLYLRALAHYNRANDQYILTPVEMPRAIALFEQALARDPQYARAAAALASAHMYMYWFGPDRNDARLEAARIAAERALALQPDLGDAHYAMALYVYWGHRDYAAARAETQLARRTMPNNSNVEITDASIARRQGQWEAALSGYKRSAEFNPRSSAPYYEIGQTYMNMRRYAEADAAYSQAVELTPGPDTELVRRGQNTVFWTGDVEPMRAAVSALKPGTDSYDASGWRIFQVAWWSRDFKAAAELADAAGEGNWYDESNQVVPKRLCLAWAYTALGDHERAKPLYAELREQMLTAIADRPEDPDRHMILALAAAGLGMKDEAIAEGRKGAALMPVERDAYSGPGYAARLAQVYVRVGENAQAIDVIHELLTIPAGIVMSAAYLRVDPVWDPLRGDPRFQELIGASDETK